MRAWSWAGVVGVGLGCALGCSESVPLAMNACFEGRAFEDWEREGQVCRMEADNGADGTIDNAQIYEFDERGRVIAVRDQDGELSQEIVRDDEARSVTYVSYSPDGQVQDRLVERLDEHGNVMASEMDRDGDGDVDAIETNDYGCWAGEPDDGWPDACVTEIDSDADGEVDRTITNAWDERERKVSTIEEDHERGEVTRWLTEHADDGTRERTERDDGWDGTIDAIYGTDYDDEQRVVRTWSDDDADGREDRFTEREYDDEGRMVSMEIVDADGYLRFAWSYAARGRVTETREQGGTVTAMDTREIIVDRGGNIIAEAIDIDEDGEPDACTYYSYACWFD